MSLRFRYKSIAIARPLVSLGGSRYRPRPVIPLCVIGPQGSWVQDALLDTAADDTVFPERVAAAIGLDLTGAPTGLSSGATGGPFLQRYAEVTLRLVDPNEQREWRAWVGFTSAPLRQPLIGYAGFLQFFSATFFGEQREVELTVNGSYPGT